MKLCLGQICVVRHQFAVWREIESNEILKFLQPGEYFIMLDYKVQDKETYYVALTSHGIVITGYWCEDVAFASHFEMLTC